jgi:hypothetical protein
MVGEPEDDGPVDGDFGDSIDEPGPEGEATFEGDLPPRTGGGAQACPEVNDPPTYKITWKNKHIKATPNRSTWLEPGDSLKWTTTRDYTFGVDVTAGAEAEAGVVLTKAKVKLDVKITNSWKSGEGYEVTSHNKTNKGYRAVLGNMGREVTYTKTWIVKPCAVKTSKGKMTYPVEGDISIGRYSK